MNPRITAWLVCLTICTSTGAAVAQERARVYVVPPLRGAVLLRGGLQGPVRALRAPPEALPERLLRAELGYLHYLTPHGQVALGGLVGVVSSLEGASVAAPSVGRVDFSGALRLRGTSPDFFTFSIGLALEAGPIVVRDRPSGGPDSLGMRAALVVETGPGLLWYFSPYLFGEMLGSVGVEWTDVDGVRSAVIIGGLSFAFDFAARDRP